MIPKMHSHAAIYRRRTCGGVTSIEYALMGTLIAIAIIVGVGATGEANRQIWASWTGKVIHVVKGALGS